MAFPRVELGEILLGRPTEVDMSGLLSTGDLRLDGEILRGGEVVKQYVDEIFLNHLGNAFRTGTGVDLQDDIVPSSGLEFSTRA